MPVPEWTPIALNWVDAVVLGLLLLSVLVGCVRGLVLELASLVGWVVAYVVAGVGAPWLSPYLPVIAAGAHLNLAIAWALCFIGVLLVWGLAARLLRMLVHATPLSGVDRLMGAVFGLVRGLLLLLVTTALLRLTPWSEAPAWRTSQAAVWLESVLDEIKPLLPHAVSRHMADAGSRGNLF